jgi:NAD-dependent deacetylase
MLDFKSQKQLRHNVVMFGEMPHHIMQAVELCNNCDILIIIGTSLSVYPAADIVLHSKCKEKYYIDPCPPEDEMVGYGISQFQMKAQDGLKNIIETLEL